MLEVSAVEKRFEIGNFIYQLRTERGYTQKELGALLGVTDKAVSKWETGAAIPRRAVLRQLSVALGCTQEELLLGRRIERADAADAKPDEDVTEEYSAVMKCCQRWRRAVTAAELCVCLVLAALVCIFGFRKGIWDNATFYGAAREGEKTVYARSDGSTVVEVLSGGEENTLHIRSGEDKTAQFFFEITENGSLKTVRLFSAGSAPVLRGTYSAGKWTVVQECRLESGAYHAAGTGSRLASGGIVNALLWDTARFTPGLSDEGVLDMAAGNVGRRLSGRPAELLLGTLFLALGFSVHILTKFLVMLDKAFLGLFYENARKLRTSGLAQACLIFLGAALFVIGVLFYKNLLLA